MEYGWDNLTKIDSCSKESCLREARFFEQRVYRMVASKSRRHKEIEYAAKMAEHFYKLAAQRTF